MPPGAADKPVEIWFQDEARVGQQGTLTKIWAPRGTRPAMVRDNRHSCTYLFGAFCPARDTGAALVLPFVSAEAMSLHLLEISHAVMPGAHAVLVLDGAGWHQNGQRLTVPENITLLRLPPYAPELNPSENVWQFLRQNYLSHLVWDKLESIIDACCQAWNKLIAETGRITSITSRNWANVS